MKLRRFHMPFGWRLITVLILLISMGEVHASPVSVNRYFLDNEAITIENSSVLIATHLTTDYDKDHLTEAASQAVIKKAKEAGFDLDYLISWPFENLSPAEKTDLEALHSRSDLINRVWPIVERKMQNYFLPAITPDRFIGSSSGDLYQLSAPNLKQAVFVGGFLDACLGFSIDSLLKAFAKNQQPVLTVYVVTDGVYLNMCPSRLFTTMTLEECRHQAPIDSYNQYVQQNLTGSGPSLRLSMNIMDGQKTLYHSSEPGKKSVIFELVPSSQLTLPH